MKIKRISMEIVMLVISILYLIPAWLVLVNSLKDSKAANKLSIGLPSDFKFENYITVFKEGNVFRSLINGVFIASVSVFLVILFSSIAAFVIARRKSKTTEFVFSLIVAGLIVPGAIIPSFIVLKVLGLLNTYAGLIFMYTTYCLPVSVFLYAGFIKSVPKELDEASVMDGCGSLRLFFQIVFPLLKPVTITVVVFNFMGIWNDIQTQLFLAGSDKWTMPMTVYSFYGKYSQNWNLVFADVIITILPILGLYIFGQKYMVSGMTAGAVKG